jgi:2-desacetyl-2-hydroxyethyl bacteriochlorophyllide A dehydrogenase
MMHAIVVEAPGRHAFRDVEIPAYAADEVLIGSVVAAMCGTDVKILRGLLPDGVASYPCIPGHEWSGVVEAVGARVSDLSVGDRVISEGLLRCGTCPRCLAGETNLCVNYSQLGFTRGGGFGAYVTTPRRVVHRIPDTVGFAAAALVEPLACIVHAFERSGVGPGDSVAVVGGGGLGSLAVLLARQIGARRVVVYDVSETELTLARRLGADQAIDATEPVAPDEPADVTVETSGSPAALRTAIAATRRGGRVVLLGTAGKGASITFQDDEIVRRELDVVGSLSYTAAAWTTSLDLVVDVKIDVGSVITHRFAISDYEAALRMFEDRTEPVGRIVLSHET